MKHNYVIISLRVNKFKSLLAHDDLKRLFSIFYENIQ